MMLFYVPCHGPYYVYHMQCVALIKIGFYFIGIIDYKGTPDFTDLELFNMACNKYLKVTKNSDGLYGVEVAERPLVSII